MKILPLRSILASLLALTLLSAPVRATDNLPKLTEQSDYQAARLDPREPEMQINFPAAATNKGIADGVAMISVGVDAEGQVTDSMLVGCSDLIFGRALLDWVKVMKFEPAKYRGQAVPGRCQVGYRFEFRTSSSCDQKFGFSAWGSTTGGLSVGGAAMTMDIFRYFSGQGLKQAPVVMLEAEKDLDQPLEFTEVGLPKLPLAYTGATDRPVKVFVTFYIDEEGKVRLPSVESAAAPELIPGALKAVSTWRFKPATVKGKPTTVYTARRVGFVPRDYVAALTAK